ncbi:hypothetical protein PALB_2160 [Pseudoalteromonas luteoviolacea B = ATCC 29581]|nr:hypothetical protein PALB_2160 [Pseudoalteromonas luteoviolacea B = ATCC 29581]
MFQTIALFLIIFCSFSFADTTELKSPASRLSFSPTSETNWPEYFTLESHSSTHFKANESHWFYLPAYEALTVEKNATTLTWDEGLNPTIRKTITPNLWVCDALAQCYLPPSSNSRLLRAENSADFARQLKIYTQYQGKHDGLFWQTYKTALPVTWLEFQSQREAFYQLTPNSPLELYFDKAVYLKVQIRYIDKVTENTKVRIAVNGEQLALLEPSSAPALEYAPRKVGLNSEEFLSVCAGCYLKIDSNNDAHFRLFIAKRPWLDTDSDEHLKLNLVLPHWYQTLDSLTQATLTDKQLDVFTFEHNASLLEQKRRKELKRALTTSQFLTPIFGVQSHTMKQSQARVITHYRERDNHIYPVLSTDTIELHQLTKVTSFDVSSLQRIESTARLFIRANTHAELTISTANDVQKLSVLPSVHLSAIDIEILAEDNFSIETSAPIELGVQIEVLSRYPDHRGWFHYARSTKTTPKSIQALFDTSRLDELTRYKATLPSLSTEPNTESTLKKRTKIHWYQKLGELEEKAKTHYPTTLFADIDDLLTSEYSEIRDRTWQIRIALFEKLGYRTLAIHYLEALINQSDSATLSQFAANSLFNYYYEEKNWFALRGLCALAYAQIEQCPNVIQKITFINQQWVELTWSTLLNHNDGLQRPAMEALNWSMDSTTPKFVNSTINHYGQVSLVSENNTSTWYVISKNNPITIKTDHATSLALSVRALNKDPSRQNINWLSIVQGDAHRILPVFADIEAKTTRINKADSEKVNTQSVSIMSREILSIDKEKPLILHSEDTLLVQFSAYSPQGILPLSIGFNWLGSNWLDVNDFMAALEQGSLSETELLNLGLYYLDQGALYQHAYIALLNQAQILGVRRALDTRLSRIYDYGEWQSVTDYVNYSSNQLIDIREKNVISSFEATTAHVVESRVQGLPIRANHLFSLDISKLSVPALRLVFNYLVPPFSPSTHTHVQVEYTQSQQVTVNKNQNVTVGIELGSAKKDIQIKWHEPNLGEMVTVELLVPNAQGHWEPFYLEDRQRFYQNDSEHPIEFTLSRDAFVKIEAIESSARIEHVGFYPAGKVSLSDSNLTARAFTWQLALSPQPKLTYQAPEYTFNPIQIESFSQEVTQLEIVNFPVIVPNDWYHYAQLELREQRIFDSDEDLVSRISQTLTLGLKKRFNNQWLGLSLGYGFEHNHHNSWQLAAKHTWRSDTSTWFSVTNWRGYYQAADYPNPSAWRSLLSVGAGQQWIIDNTWQLKWLLAPFVNQSNVDNVGYFRDPKITPDIFSYYRDDHKHGWVLELDAALRVFTDIRWSAGLQLTSNQDWRSLDNTNFFWGVTQHYQGQVLQSQFLHRYRFADEHRAVAYWEHAFLAKWHIPFTLSKNHIAWFDLNWRKSLSDNKYNFSINLRIGNEGHTGYEPFSPDEIVFESLRIAHLYHEIEAVNE